MSFTSNLVVHSNVGARYLCFKSPVGKVRCVQDVTFTENKICRKFQVLGNISVKDPENEKQIKSGIREL